MSHPSMRVVVVWPNTVFLDGIIRVRCFQSIPANAILADCILVQFHRLAGQIDASSSAHPTIALPDGGDRGECRRAEEASLPSRFSRQSVYFLESIQPKSFL